jgi:hypothetical protein
MALVKADPDNSPSAILGATDFIVEGGESG